MKYQEKKFTVPVQVGISQERWDSIFMANREKKSIAAIVPQDATTGVAAFFGTWPGDETDEELLRKLKDID